MNLRDCSFAYTYGQQDDRVNGFYVPALGCSIRYDRSAGFFSSSALAVAATGVARLIENKGSMRLLVGAQLSEEDVTALIGGAELARIVADRMSQGLEQRIDAIAEERLAALAWMIHTRTLEVKVVLPTSPEGRPLSAAECYDYFHAKFGIFTDALGDRVAFVGSINEGEQAWLHNFEMFSVYCSWREKQYAYIDDYQARFIRLWEIKEKGWIALTIPRAVEERLLRYRPMVPPKRDPLEPKPPEPEEPTSGAAAGAASAREAALFQFLRDAPFFPDGGRLAEEGSAAKLWPHQARVVEKVVRSFPEPYLLCDEVGLGKTLEAGAILKHLLLCGKVRRCLILTPKSVCRQWQEELYESFLLNVPQFDGSSYSDYFERQMPATTENPWDSYPVLIASSQLAKRRDHAATLLAAQPWDLVIVDEAHHARRKDFLSGRYRRNRLLSLLLGEQDAAGSRGLSTNTRGLLLLTATPMQVDPREVWDLLTVLGMGGKWGSSDELFVRFFRELRNGTGADWSFLLSMVRDHLENGGRIDDLVARVCKDKVGPVDWAVICDLPFSGKVHAQLNQLDSTRRQVLLEFIKRTTPLSRYLFRNTRDLLRRYENRGMLGTGRVPTRKPQPVWIPMESDERSLYDRIEEYISDFYKKYEEQRTGLGFIMTVYRRRLTSSFKAIELSLERRLAFLRGEPESSPTSGLGDEDFEDEDLSDDALEEVTPPESSIARAEIEYIERFIQDLRNLGSDSKAARLLDHLQRLLERRETIIVFTLYTDTMDWLREKLRSIYGDQVACYSGRGAEVWKGGSWQRIKKEDLKADFAAEKIKILLGTDAMSEGLNLQTCGMMINYDMPWNPMRVEQRIGRIDRIEQRYPEVWIYNYFYEETVEADVYRALEKRISWFETVIGDLQPILARVARAIQDLAMMDRSQRAESMASLISDIEQQIKDEQAQALHLDDYLDIDESLPRQEAPVVTREELERFLHGTPVTRNRLVPSPEKAEVYVLEMDGKKWPVTFDADLFTKAPAELHLLTYGEPLFHRLIESVAPFKETDLPQWVLRMESRDPRFSAWYRLEGGGASRIRRFADLREVLAMESVAFDAGARESAISEFNKALVEAKEREHEILRSRLKARAEALKERGRQLLLKATYLDIALSLQPGTEEASEASLFNAKAVVNLRRHGYPFTALIKQVTVEGIDPLPSDLYWQEARAARPEALKRRFEEVKRRSTEVVNELSSLGG